MHKPNFECPLIDEARSTGRGKNLWREILAAGLIMFAISTIVDIFSGLLLEGILCLADETILSLGYLYTRVFVIVLVAVFCRTIQRRTLNNIGFVQANIFNRYAKGMVVGFAMICAVTIIGLLAGSFKYNGLYPNIHPLFLILFFGGYFVQGMAEEVLCRGYAMISIARKNHVAAAVIANSILFSLMHMFNAGFGIIPMINLFLFAIFESLYMLKTGDIWGVSAIHTIWNFAQGCIFGFSVSGNSLTPTIFTMDCVGAELISGGEFGPEGGLIVSCVTIVAIFILTFSTKNLQNK